MYWNYRVVKHSEKDGSVWYAIHEAYYTVESVTHISELAAEPGGETIEELAEELRRMLKATEKPALNYEDF